MAGFTQTSVVLVVGYALELIRLQSFVTLNDGLAVNIREHSWLRLFDTYLASCLVPNDVLSVVAETF